MTQRQRRRQRRRGHNGGLSSKLLVAVAAIVATIALAGLAFGSWVMSVADDAPPLSACKPIDKGGNSILIDGNGERLGYIRSDEARTPVAVRRVPVDTRYATVAIEDERFFKHDGIDVEGGLRALVENVEAGKVVQGGSTITMQLMRNLCITDPKRNIERKIQEAKLALDYEDRHSKQRILGQYLNSASYGTVNGRTAVGIQAASKIFFSKPIWKLTLEQAALLAGLPQAPSEYNPLLNPRGAKQRRNEVLDRMADLGYISRARALEGQQRGLALNPSDEYSERREPYFFDYVESKLIESYGVNTVRKGGLKVYTTIDPRLQEIGRDAINSILYYPDDPSSAIAAIDPHSGEIKAMASSGNYESNQYNLAAQGRRQAGSAFKTFVLTAAINQGIDPYSTYYESKPLDLDLPEYGRWSVSTYSQTYSGAMSIHDATLASDNTVYAQLDLDVGPEEVAETAKKMGIETELDGIPAEGLGGLRIGVSPLEMSNAYATLAAGGVHRDPVAIRKVVLPGGQVHHPEEADPKRVLPEAVAYEVTRVLRDNITSGTGTAAYTGCYGQAGKTGTVDNFTDAWFMGYQPNLSTGVWVGYPESNAIEMTSVHGISVAGGTFPAEIWNAFYLGAGIPCEDFETPEEPIDWSSFFGTYAVSGSSDSYDYEYSSEPSVEEDAGKDPDAAGGADDGSSGQNYDSDLYAPGAGQDSAPSPPPSPSLPPSQGGGTGGGPSGGIGGGN